MKRNHLIQGLSSNFREEEKKLLSHGIDSWELIRSLKDNEISNLVKNSLLSTRNLNRLRCMAIFVCELNLSQGEAALLMHAGIPTVNALANLNPEELHQKINRLARQLNTGQHAFINLSKANAWITKAKKIQNLN